MERCGAKRFILLFLTVLTLLCGAVPFVSAQEQDSEEETYVENEWNFVEGSMDISGGIPSDAVGVLERILITGKLRVATEPYFPPQEFIDPAKKGQESFVGPDMELARLIAKRMGVMLEIVPMDFSEVLPAVTDGQCDLAISALAYTPARAMMVELSKGYYFLLCRKWRNSIN